MTTMKHLMDGFYALAQEAKAEGKFEKAFALRTAEDLANNGHGMNNLQLFTFLERALTENLEVTEGEEAEGWSAALTYLLQMRTTFLGA